MNRYLELRDQIKPGDAFVEEGTGLIPKEIELLGGRWRGHGLSHALMAIKLQEDLVDHFFCIEALEDGLDLIKLSGEINNTIAKSGHVWWIPLKDEFEWARPGLQSWALDHIAVGYDFKGLFGYNLPMITFNERRMFCSAVLYWDCVENKITERREKPWRPVDVANYGPYKEAIQIG